MSAQPVQEFDPDDPMEITRVLPARYHGQFQADYDAPRPALAGLTSTTSCTRPEALAAAGWACSDPDFEARLEAAHSAPGHGTPIEDVVPDWAEKVAAARRQRGGA